MPVAGSVKKDQYILGQSVKKSLEELGEEIRLDLALVPNPNLNGGTIIGIVKDSTGNPIEGALIKIMDSSHTPLAHAFTGADGAYSFNPFPPGNDYHIYATKQGYKLTEGVSFTLGKDQQVQKDFVLPVDTNAALAIIAGDVMNSTTNLPINGAAVNLYSVDGQGVETLVALSFTNQYGQFVFSELPSGNYLTRVNALGYKPHSVTSLINTQGQIVNPQLSLDIDPNTARGTISGIITDNNNLPIANADVVLYSVGTNDTLKPIAFNKTTTEGLYLFINVPKGDYKIKSNKIVITQSI